MGAISKILFAFAGTFCGTQDPIHISAAVGVFTACGLCAWRVIYAGDPFDAYGFLLGLAALCGGVGVGVGARDRLQGPQSPKPGA